VSVIIFVASVVLFLFTVERNTVLKDLVLARDRKRLGSIGKLVANEVDKYIRGKSFEDIQNILTAVQNQDEIKFISIIGIDNIVNYSTIEHIRGKLNPYTDSDSMVKEIGETYIKSFPIEFEDEIIGYVQVGYDMVPTKKTIHSSFRNALFSNCMFLVGLFIIGWYLSGALLKPLNDVRQGAKSIARGNFSLRLPVKSKDILGQLAQSMNEMAQQLGELTGNMQQKIDRATLDLKETNKKLESQKEELRKKNEQLRELDKMKSDFVSLVSHELKTPLTSMIGFGKTMLIRKLPEYKVEKYLKIIVSEGKRLSYLVDEFLDISRIQSGEFNITPHKFSLKVFIKDVIETHQAQSNVEVQHKLTGADTEVEWDMNAVKQVILNLIDNASRYNPRGKPVDVTAETEDEAVNIKVRDYGPGIRKEDISKIFDKFYRADDKVNIKNKGSGLGLSIAKSIIELHQGSINVRLPVDGGTEFIIRLPKEVKNNG
jgi:signal transduction histidine kinase